MLLARQACAAGSVDQKLCLMLTLIAIFVTSPVERLHLLVLYVPEVSNPTTDLVLHMSCLCAAEPGVRRICSCAAL